MVRYQNLTRKPGLFRAPWARAPLGPGPGTMYPLNTPLTGPAGGRRWAIFFEFFLEKNFNAIWITFRTS